MPSVAFSPVYNGVTLFNASGQVLSGGKINTYLAGTTTPQVTYTTNAGNVANANPIILNSAGQAPQEIWLVQGITYKLVLTDAANTVLQTEDNIQGINDQVLNPPSEWMAQGAPTYLSPTSFSVPGNQTATFDVGRRVKSINTGGTAYSTVTGSTYNAGPNTTTVTVVNDSLPLDSGLSAVYAGVLDPAGSSVPVADIYWYNAITLRNRLIDGDFRVDQRNVGTLVPVSNTSIYTVDRWVTSCSLGVGTGTLNVTRINFLGPGGGNPYAYQGAVGTAKASLSAGDFCLVRQPIEGLNVADLLFGTSSAKAITISFTFVTSIANAVLPIAIRNGGLSRSYVTSITTGTAGTAGRYSVTIPGDTTGTWATDNTIGFDLIFGWGSGSTFQATANTWSAGNFFSIAGATNFMSNGVNTWQLTDVQLEAGTAASPMERIGFDMQLARCMRYYEKSFEYATAPAQNAGGLGCARWPQAVGAASSQGGNSIAFRVVKRADPTAPNFITYNPSAANAQARNESMGADCSAASVTSIGQSTVNFIFTSAGGSAAGQSIAVHWTADAEL
jgi:hypothetical protein